MRTPEAVEAHRQAVADLFLAFRRTPRGALRFVTTVVAAMVVRLDHDAGPALADALKRHLVEHRQVLMRNGRISRNRTGQTRWANAVEIDLLHQNTTHSVMKTELFKEFGIDVDELNQSERILVLHTHGIYDCRGHVSADRLAGDLRREWRGPRRVHVAKLYEDVSSADNLKQIAAYSAKMVHRYSHAWHGGRTTFLGDYEPDWQSYIDRIYDQIGNHRLINTNVVVQSLSKRDSYRMYANQYDSAGKLVETEPLQFDAPGASQLRVRALLSAANETLKSSVQHVSNDQRSSKENPPMRAKEIIKNYVDPSKMSTRFTKDIIDMLDRQGPGLDSNLMSAMYGDSDSELKIEQQQADLLKTKAEIAKIMADVMRDRRKAFPSISLSTEVLSVLPRSPVVLAELPASQAPPPVEERDMSPWLR